MKRFLLIFAFLSCHPLFAEMYFTREMIDSHLKGYTDDEIQLLEKDRNVVRSVCFEDVQKTSPRFYLATAGAPGARKSTILEKFVAAHPEYQKGVYLDPDPRTLKFMVHTYLARSLDHLTIATTNNYEQVIKNAYEKWRGGSNYIAVSLLEEAFNEGHSVIHGTTSTGAHVPDFLAKLKENHYQIVLLLCSCPDDVRYQAVNYRNQTVRFYQSSPEDAVAKGSLFPQKMGTYFAHADQIYFYWSDSLFSPEKLAGIWTRGKFEIHDKDAMQRFINKYESDRLALKEKGVLIPDFNNFPLK